MKSYSIVPAVVLLTVGALALNHRLCATQQSATERNSAAQVNATTPNAGEAAFYILGEFTQSLNAKKLKTGDKINAQVTQDVLSHGRIIIPSESRLVGHVTEVKFREGQDSESRLGIIFDKVLLRHHKEVDFRGVLQALSAPAERPSRADLPDPMMPPSLMGSGVGRATSPVPVGTGPSGRSTGASSATNPAGPMPAFDKVAPLTTVPTVNTGNPASDVSGSKGTQRINSAQRQPMSVGMPLGVFGLKGLALTPGTSNETGPVIRSRMENIKLESGTQVLLKVTDAAFPQP